MSNKGDYTIELTEIVVSLKNSLDRCITLIRKITDENVDLNKSNHTLNSLSTTLSSSSEPDLSADSESADSFLACSSAACW